MQEKLEKNGRDISRRMVGGVETLLVEGASKKRKGEMSGRAGNKRVVNFSRR